MEEKKQKTKKKLWPFVLGIVFLVLVLAGMFFYFVTASPSKPRAGTEVQNPIKDLTIEQAILQFNGEYIRYLVFAIGGWKLHNPPLSDETPKIKVIVDNEVFISEIVNGEIKTEKKETESSLETSETLVSDSAQKSLISDKTSEKEEDMIIGTTKQEIVNSIKSLDMKNYIKQSVQDGKTSLELKAGYTTLFSKGYLNLYQDITGKSFTGSVVRIFGQG